MILLFTDFGAAGPYLGQLRTVLAAEAPGVPVIDLMSDAPTHDPFSASDLLAALASHVPAGSVVLAVVDPGVGGERRPAIAEIDGSWYVGPDNGLFEPLLGRADDARWWEISWRPATLSSSFHGRDLFAPIAARLARGERPEADPAMAIERPIAELRRPDWPNELPRIIYIDHYGNAVTGMRAASLGDKALLEAGGRPIARARTFGDRPPGGAFWYMNSSGLAEIAVNQGRADATLGLSIGSPVIVI